jgi:ABC-2 type transport system ATP-binding protein
MIEVRTLEKSFASRAVLRGLDLRVPAGEVTLLLGANGAGKTTLLRIVTGILAPDAGSVHVAGHDVRHERLAALSALAFLPQAPRFHPRLSVAQVASYYARLRGRAGDEVALALADWGLSDHARDETLALSGGLRQRLALAIFFLARAPVLVLDEPGLSLDPEWRMRLQERLAAEARSGATVLVATHLLGEWEGQADACVVLEGGRLARQLPAAHLRATFFLPRGVKVS